MYMSLFIMSKTATANTNQPDKIILTEMFI